MHLTTIAGECKHLQTFAFASAVALPLVSPLVFLRLIDACIHANSDYYALYY